MTAALPRIWFEGRILAADEPIVTALDQGLLLGDGVFEVLVVRERRPVMLDRHLRRLRRGLDRLGIVGAPADADLADAIDAVVADADLEAARIRITVSPGPGPGPRQRGNAPLCVIAIDRLEAPPDSTTLTIVPWPRNERSPLAGIKAAAWSENAFALRHATAKGYGNALFLDTTGRLSECATANIFLVIDEEVLTPTLASGCLAGTAREVLMERGVARDCDLRPSDLERADAVFITSATGLVPVTRIDDLEFPSGSPAIERARGALVGD